MHLHNLLGDGEAEASPTLGLGVGAVDLMELLEDAYLMLRGNAWPCIGHTDVEVAVDGLCSHADLADISEFDGVAYKVEEYLRDALLVSEANRERLVHGRRER